MRKKAIITILFLLLAGGIYTNAGVFAQTTDNDVYQLQATQNINISKAEDMLKAGNVDGALGVYTSILDKDPKSIPARIGVAKVYSQLYKLKAAQREFNKVLAQDPNNSEAHNGLGLSYYRQTTSSNMDIRESMGDLYNKAAEEFKKAIASNPRNADALANLGVIYQHQGRLDEAEAKYNEALTVDPNNPTANYSLGTILYQKGDVDNAIAGYNKAIAVDSKNSTAYYHLGEALISKGDYSKAIDALQTSLYLYPTSAPVHEKLGEAYKHQGNETAAIEEFKKSIAIKPEDTLPYLLLSSVYEDRGDDELAIAELKSALKNNPNFAEANVKIANMSLKAGKVDQAIEYYQKTLIDDPGNPDAEKGISKAYFRKVQADVASGIVAAPNKLLEAEKTVNKAIANNPDDLELHYAKFKLEKMTDKPKPTEAELTQMAGSTPTNVPQLLDKGYALFELKDFNQANNTFRSVINQLKNPEDRLMVAQTLIAYKNYDVAKEIFDIVQTESPNNVEAQRGLEKINKSKSKATEDFTLGFDLFKKGQRKSALDQFKKAQDIDPTLGKSYYWAAETLKKDDKFQSALQNYKIFLALTENMPDKATNKELMDQIKHATKMVDKLKDKPDKVKK